MCPLPAWSTIESATCQHCPNDLFAGVDYHRTCSDHGVCIDATTCRCDPEWTGATCDTLACLNNCNNHGECTNERSPSVCDLGNGTDPTIGLCQSIDDNCVAAYHDCPYKGISSQVDSTGIVIEPLPRHNTILYARCVCLDEWSGNDCTIEPPPPPTLQPWPDPYSGSGAPGRRGGRVLLMSVVTVVCCVLGLALL